MSKKFGFAVVALCVLLAFSLVTGSSGASVARSLGVRVGDRASYSLICTGVPDWNRFDISITKIQGTIVSYTVTFFQSNGEIGLTMHYVQDIEDYDGFVDPYVLAANLSAGDQIAAYSGSPRTINNTLLMDVAGSQRLVNYKEFLIIYYYPNVTDLPVIIGYDMYWDKSTGMTVKANVDWNSGYSIPHWDGWFNWTITSLQTGSGTSGADPTAALILVGASVTLIVAVVAVAAVTGRRRVLP